MVEQRSRSAPRETWESAAPGWAKWEHAFSAGLADATDRLIDMAGIEPGMRVLDLACGAGNQTIRAARRVGPNGSVVASDISPTMLEYVRQSAAKAALHNIETREGAAEELDEAQERFDAAISRLGLMLFASPIAAVEAVRRVLKPNARFAALCFTTPAKNPFFAQSMAVLLRHRQTTTATRKPRTIRAWRRRRPGTPFAGRRTRGHKNKNDPGFVKSTKRPRDLGDDAGGFWCLSRSHSGSQ